MEEKELSQMNVIPLVDVMLVLLTIVLTTATFIAQGEIPLNLPKARSGETSKDIEALEITLTKEGFLFLGSERITLKALEERLARTERSVRVRIRADEGVRFGRVVEVMDLLRGRGFNRVSVSVRKDGL
jgi:biopolymer transport protein ExbD